MKQNYRRFSENLVYYLADKGMNRADLARRMHVSRGTVTNWCNGNKYPHADTLENLCKVLNCSIAELTERYADEAEHDTKVIRLYHQLDKREREIVDYILESHHEQV